MADKVTILDININTDDALKSSANLRAEINKLKASQKELKKENQEGSVEYAKNEAQIKALQTEMRNQDAITKNVITTQRQQVGTITKLEAQNAALRAEQKKLNLETKEGVKRNKEIVKQINKNTETIKDNSDKTKKYKMNIGNYASAFEGAGVPINLATSATQTFGTALKVALGPIGLIIAALGALIAFFKRSEEGQDAFNKILAVFGVIINNLLDIISKFGAALFKAISKPREAFQNFVDFFKNTFGKVIVGQFQIIILSISKFVQRIVLAFKKLKGLIKSNGDEIAAQQKKLDEIDKKIADARQKRDEGARATKEIIIKTVQRHIEEQKREIAIAKRLADIQAANDKRIRAALVAEAQDRLKLAQLRNSIEEKEKLTAQERIGLIEEENKILDGILERNLRIAKSKLFVQQEQNKLSESTKEDLMKEAELQAEVFRVQEQIESQRKESITKRLEAERQIQAENKAAAQESIKLMEMELDRFLLLNQEKLSSSEELNQEIVDNEIARLNEINEKETEILQSRYENGLIQKEQYDLALLELEISLNESISGIRQEFEEAEMVRRAEAVKTDFENQMAIAEGNLFAELELERQALEQKRAQELEIAEKTGADKSKIIAKFDKAELALEKAKIEAKLALAGGFAQNIAQIFGEQTAVGKAAAVASTTIATFQSATQAFSSLSGIPIVGPVLGAVAAAAAVASGLANVKKILSVKSGLPGESGVSSSTPSGGAVPSAPAVARTTVSPEVGQGIVSRDTGDNIVDQVSEGVTKGVNNSQSKNVLVSDDVTVKQTQENQISETAVI